MKKPDSVYHLSHTDLDGYACQFLASRCFENIKFQNSNYGDEINGRLKIFFDLMLLDGSKKILLLITDLNLSVSQCEFIEQQIEKLQSFKKDIHIELQLLDHHGSGSDAAQKYGWYFLDTSRSATRITFDWLVENFGCEEIKSYRQIVDAVNAIDIWLKDEEGFEFGKVLMGAIASSREVGRALFDEHDRAHKFHLIESAHSMIDEADAHIRLDNEMHAIKKAFFGAGKSDNTLDNLVADYLTDLLSTKKDELKISYRDKTGILTYALPNISVIGNAFLVANPDIDFILNISPNGSIGLRSNNRVDVSEIAATLAGGGGHPNASGGRIQGFKELYSYEHVKAFIENVIEEKTKS